MSRAIVQVFAYDEPDLAGTLDAYAACTVPSGWEVDYWACVTPRPAEPKEVLHYRVETARAHDVFELVETPPGKLASRNVAHDRAVEAGADVIVVGDADAPPLSADYLEHLLGPFASDEVVATNARPVTPWTPIGAATNVIGWTHDVMVPHINGQGHAFQTKGWGVAGPFDVDDQTAIAEVRLEEELEFRRRLAATGDVVDAPRAQVHNDTRRALCRLTALLPGEAAPYCARIGAETFAPALSRRNYG